MKNLMKALAEFQQECPTIPKQSTADVTTAKGGKYSYHYADLPSIMTIINPFLAKHGLVLSQPLVMDNGLRCVRTILYHLDSGETLESMMEIPKVSFTGMNDYQALGSGATYVRRYGLSILGIVTDEDNDAAWEQENTPAAKTINKPPNDKAKWITDKEVERYVYRIREGEYKGMDADNFMANLRKHFAVNKKHEKTLRAEFEFEQTLNG